MKNVQISFDEKLLKEIDSVVERQRSSRSAIIREALKYWIQRKEIHDFEQLWIQKLKENPQDSSDSEAWIQAEHWEEG
jgi:metal-responsive CopG/Arc/MetJ family transcriptional regulator